jgi:hypothetical protein
VEDKIVSGVTAVVLIITLSLAVMRIYLRRKLAKQRILLEKQQAIQKERNTNLQPICMTTSGAVNYRV